MQELKTSTEAGVQELTERSVTIFLEPYFITLRGRWYWDFVSESVFCSNVMLSWGQGLEATRGIIHPDDVDKVKTKLEADTIRHLEFRIITTYGDVRTIAGEMLAVDSRTEFFDEAAKQVQALSRDAVDKKELEHLQLFKEVHEKAARFTNTGIWWHNAATGATLYSAEVFRIYELAPFSLNPHLNTFLHFIHPEDRDVVEEYISRSYKQKAPLHIEYRIQTAAGEKYVQHVSQWMYSANGEPVLGGMLREITEEEKKEIQFEESERKVNFFKQQLLFDEQNNALVHWYVNLVTRKFVFSNNYYRLFGLRGKIAIDPAAFNDHIHPDDREAYRLATKKMLHQHAPPEMEFRIYRGDGKLRYFCQKAKLVADGNDLIMMGTIEDVTVKTVLQNKIREFSETEAVRKFAQRQMEEMTGMAGWIWNTSDSSIEWSENFTNFLGVKPSGKELTHKFFLSFIHPEDQKLFGDHMNLLLQQKQEASFDFRLQLWGKTKYVRASFRMMKQEEEELFIAIFRDVTGERLLEEELNQKVQLAEALSDNILDRIIITDVYNTIKLWNKACEDGYGIGADEATGKNFFDVFPNLKTEEEIVLFNRVLKGERIFLKANRSATNRAYHDLHLLPVWDNKHTEVNGIVHILHDVTQEVELQQNLSERLRFIESLVESSPDRIIAIDRNLNYLVWNKKAEEYYRLRKQDMVGKNVLEIFPYAQNTPTYDQLRRVLKGETVSLSFEEEDAFFTTVLIPIKNEKEEVTAVLWMDHDVSNEYKLQQEQAKIIELLQTEQQRLSDAQKELVKANEVLELALESAQAGTGWWNVKTGEADWDERVCKLIGFDTAKENKTVAAWLSRLHEEDQPKVTALVRESIRKGKDFHVEFRMVCNGELRYFLGTGHFKTDQAGELIEGYGLMIDITQRKLAEEKLKESKRFIAEVTQRTPDLITIHDAVSNQIIYANHDDFWKGLYGSDEVYMMEDEQRASAIIHPDDLEKAKAFLQERRRLQDGEVKEVELKMMSGRWIRIRSKVFKRAASGDAQQIISFSTDITAAKKAEDEIKNQLTLLRYTEYLAQSGTWEYHVATQEFRWSEGMYKIFGLPQQMIVRPEIYLDAAIHEDRPIAKIIVNHLRKKPDPFEEIIRIKKNNEVRTLKIRASVIRDVNGKPQKVIGVDVDVSDVKKAEEQLKESQHWLEQTAIASPDAITVYDLQNKRPFYLNNCLAQWLGVSKEELAAMNIEGRLELVHPDDRLRLLHFNGRMAEASDGKVLTIEYRIRTDKDKLIWLRNRSKVFQRDASGKVTHVLSVLENVTREVELREDLKRRTQFAETILDASTNRITVFDRDYRFVGWNKQCEEVHGVKRENVIGKTIFEIFPGVENFPAIVNAQERSVRGEYVHLPPIKDNFTDAYLEFFYVPLKNESGETYAVVNIMNDVTDYVRNTESLDALNKKLETKNIELEQKNEEITNFAFVASHDMKEPLRKIHTFSDWLIEQEENRLSPQGKSLIEKIHVSVHRMEALIDDILILTKIHSDAKREEMVDLNKIIGLVMEEMSGQIEATGTVIRKDELPLLKANSNQMFYLFKNFISNAIKFQPSGNRPEITITSEVVISGKVKMNTSGEEYLRLSFRDNGIGFDKRYAKKIFQVFQRLHGRNEFEGTGIGLAICKKIMENHAGMIAVESEPGKGSVFSCYFPLH